MLPGTVLCRKQSDIMLSMIMLRVLMLSVLMLSVVMLNITMLIAIALTFHKFAFIFTSENNGTAQCRHMQGAATYTIKTLSHSVI
jgi:hypothetical protein